MKERYIWQDLQLANWIRSWHTYYKEAAEKMESCFDEGEAGYLDALEAIIKADRSFIEALQSNIEDVTKQKNKLLWEE